MPLPNNHSIWTCQPGMAGERPANSPAEPVMELNLELQRSSFSLCRRQPQPLFRSQDNPLDLKRKDRIEPRGQLGEVARERAGLALQKFAGQVVDQVSAGNV